MASLTNLSQPLLKLCFATNNQHKLAEVIAALGNTEAIRLTTLAEAGIFEELPETQDSIEGNARQKALHVFEHYAIDCFADDTGLARPEDAAGDQMQDVLFPVNDDGVAGVVAALGAHDDV